MRLKPNMIIGVSVFIILLILLSLAQEMNRRWQVQREVQRLEEQARELESNVISLENLNQYFRTDDFQERLAREKLNYSAPGEEVVLIPEQDAAAESSASQTKEKAQEISLPLQWWNVFFMEEKRLPAG